MRTLVSLLLIALALYTVEALAQDALQPADQSAKTEAGVGAPGNDCDGCIKNMDPGTHVVKDPLILPAGATASGGQSTKGTGER